MKDNEYKYRLEFFFPNEKDISYNEVNDFMDYVLAHIGSINAVHTEFNKDDLPEKYVQKHISFDIDTSSEVTRDKITLLEDFTHPFKVSHIKISKVMYDEVYYN